SHLRMERKYGLHQADEPDDKNVHVVFHMTDGTQLRYRDVRKFGTMHLFAPGEEQNALPLSQLGPEPDDEAFTAAYLKERLVKTNRAVKT
ncbi:DNA-formamidopyrimidine glycosylase family protein, partial [Lysinibacillus sp. D4A1_S13]|uniref:DNA-formamidopyrimidine glycosylase family protein n=1 Tax=Lysinibacillus sp. D4A1_S13 TaxID=2941228 RepID=UPI0024BDE84B